MKKNINGLRAHLFDVLQQLKEGKIDVNQAKVASEVSQTIINSVKVELDFIKQTGGVGTNFITPEAEDAPAEEVRLIEQPKPNAEKKKPVFEYADDFQHRPKAKEEKPAEKKEAAAKPVKHKSVPNPVLVEDSPKETIVRPKAQYSNRGYLTLLDEYAPGN